MHVCVLYRHQYKQWLFPCTAWNGLFLSNQHGVFVTQDKQSLNLILINYTIQGFGARIKYPYTVQNTRGLKIAACSFV